ncbi:hypothetical protein CALVIDRAFT_562653 [Calocera viscosa TUFC12733]|uniref:Uncharacterized protein n=1 Tax=Calocera viscosa (strain TUFC12733) TaxID=1330018 RepID=A0A167NIG8_CALVF|nr:hypothetical protein CALVIDRAFT_562653 [Calocera viscosa TUFC12733]
MASIQTPIAQTPDQDAIYSDHEQTGVVHPSVLQNEESSLRELRGPEPVTVTGNDYDDKHVFVSAEKRHIVVKHWIIVHPVLVIDIDKIVWIRPASHKVLGFGCHAWGMGLTGIGWARDWHRAFPRGPAWENSFVVKYHDASLGLRAGFTIEDPTKFVETLEKIEPGIMSRSMDERNEHSGQERAGYTKLPEGTGK